MSLRSIKREIAQKQQSLSEEKAKALIHSRNSFRAASSVGKKPEALIVSFIAGLFAPKLLGDFLPEKSQLTSPLIKAVLPILLQSWLKRRKRYPRKIPPES